MDDLAAILDQLRAMGVAESVVQALKVEIETLAVDAVAGWREKFIADLSASISDAIAARTPLDAWLPDVTKILESYTGGAYAAIVLAQLTINAMNAGRYSGMFFGPAIDEYPFWMYVTADDERVCPICLPLDGKVFAKRDVSARRFLPGLHFGCRCHALDMSEADVRAGGYRVENGFAVASQPPDEGFDGDTLQTVPVALRRPVLPVKGEPGDNVLILKLRPVSAPVPVVPRKVAGRET